jgi:hypothetical protein
MNTILMQVKPLIGGDIVRVTCIRSKGFALETSGSESLTPVGFSRCYCLRIRFVRVITEDTLLRYPLKTF